MVGRERLAYFISLKRGIPRIIHYIWVGDKELSIEDKKNIEGWKQKCPGYKFMFWRGLEQEFDNEYLRNAKKLKNWANYSNLLRLLVIYKYGGVYLDTDVELIESTNSLLKDNCFFGFQTPKKDEDWVNNAVFGAKRGHWFVKKCIEELLNNFDGSEAANLSAPRMLTKLLVEHGLISQSQELVKDIRLYSRDCFYPYSWEEKYTPQCITAQTLAVHYWNKRWT